MRSLVDVKQLLRHREPFLYVDRVLLNEIGSRVVAQKNSCFARATEHSTKGECSTNIPKHHSFTRCEMLEALGQTASLILAQMEKYKNAGVPVFAAMRNVEWIHEMPRNGVFRLLVDAHLHPRQRRSFGLVHASAYSLPEQSELNGLENARVQRTLASSTQLCSAELVFSFAQQS